MKKKKKIKVESKLVFFIAILVVAVVGVFFMERMQIINLFPETLGGIQEHASVGATSVQTYFSVLNFTNSTYLPFTGGQTGTNAVPFVTIAINNASAASNNDFWRMYLADVYFNSTGIIIERNSSGNASMTTNMSVVVNVVEFDANSVRVQSGVFSLDSASVKTVGAVMGTSVNTSRTAMVFYYNSTDATDDYDTNSIRGNITNSTHLNFTMDAGATTGIKAGHWYVFESLDGSFTVQNVDIQMAHNFTTQPLPVKSAPINSVQMNKTFLIGSYFTDNPDDDSRDGSFLLNLTNSTAIMIARGNNATAPGSVNATVFVITFTGEEFVQRGQLNYSQSPASLSVVGLIPTSINTSMSMAWDPLMTGRMDDGSSAAPLESAFQYINITNSTAVTGYRGATVSSARGSFEVIQWTNNPPKWANNATNSTSVSTSINHSVNWTDDSALSGYIFSFNNGNGTFVNNSFVVFSGTQNWSNVSKTTNATAGLTIQWFVWANDSLNNVNSTSTFSYTTTAGDTAPRWFQNTTNVTQPWNTTAATWDGPGSNFSVAAQDATPLGIFFNETGTKMFMLGTANDRIYQYTLSTAWDLSTATWDGPSSNFSVAAQDTGPTGVFFNSTGTKMFMVGGTNVYRYTLSTAWDLSTATWDGVGSNFSVAAQDTGPTGIFFNSTGTKMFILGFANGAIYQYTLSQAWNTSTATWDGVGTNLSISPDTTPHGLFFNSTGTKMYITGDDSTKVYQYTLSQAWNTSSATYDGTASDLSVAGQDLNPRALFFNSTGTKMFLLGTANDRIYPYTILTTATPGSFIKHSVNWTDDTALSGYIFSFDNGTGTFTNDSFVTFTGTSNWSNVSKWVNTTANSTIQWYFWANDSVNNVNSTSIFNYTTTVTNSCTYTSGNWAINCSHYCNISSNVDLNGNNISIIGNGITTITANISNYTAGYIAGIDSSNICTIRTFNGGGIKD